MHPDIYRRVLNAKGVLQIAEQALRRQSDIDVSTALLLMHDAVELLMIAILDHVQAPANKRREFLDFWPEMKKAGQSEPPDYIAMDSLNRLRVGLKHSGNIPNSATIRALFPRTKGFFENVLALYCGLNYAEVSLFEIISSMQVKDRMRTAKERFAEGKKTEAMVELAIATEHMERPTDSHLPRLTAPPTPTIGHELRHTGLDRYFGQLHSFLQGCAALMNAQTIGYDPFEYQAFKGILPFVQKSMAGTYQSQVWLNYDTMSRDQFEVLIDYLIDHAIKLDESSQPVRPPLPKGPEGENVISVAQSLGRIRAGKSS